MVKAGRGKAETIKERAICVCLSSLDMIEDWKLMAEKAVHDGVILDIKCTE